MIPSRLFEYMHFQLKNNPQEKALGQNENGTWTFYSSAQIVELATKVSKGLIRLGLQPGERVAVAVYKNRVEWAIMDLALLQAGLINVPVYPTISPREYEYIFNDAGIKYAFVGKDDLFDKVHTAGQQIEGFQEIYTFDEREGVPYWKSIFTDEGQEELDKRMANSKNEDLATLIYTSGTTGNPKGVMLSHNNIISNVEAVKSLIPISNGQIALSFLPLCHVFERSASYAYYSRGVSIVYTGTDNLGGDDGDLKAIKPHFFTTVPRLLEKVYEKILNKGMALAGPKKSLFFWAIGLTKDYEYHKTYSGFGGLKRKIADKLIFSKWREALGGRVVGILTGAAPCPASIARVFSAAGVPIREGYGLTETSPGLAINHFKKTDCMLGTVGPALSNVTLKIDASDGDFREGEGEILARGPNIMMGYYNKPEKTAEVFKVVNGEKWFCTGDVGKLVSGPDGNQYLKITDRIKELLKTSGGKYVAPAPIESRLKENLLVEQVMVIGDKQKFVSALIIPSSDALMNWCKMHGISASSMGEAIKNEKVVKRYQDIIDKCNPDFSRIEQVKKFKLLDASWEPTKSDGSDSELTPTLKLKRRVIREKFKGLIDSIYS